MAIVVSKCHIGPIRYQVMMSGTGYHVSCSMAHGPFYNLRESPFNTQEQAEAFGKKYHIKTFGKWPRGKAGKWHL